jgi:hypothetical protein
LRLPPRAKRGAGGKDGDERRTREDVAHWSSSARRIPRR